MTSTSDAPLLDLIEAAYSAAAQPSAWPGFLEELAPRIGADQLYLVLRPPESDDAGLIYSTGAAPDWVRRYGDRYYARDPYRPRTAELQEGELALGHEVVEDDELVSTDFYRDWMEPQKIHYPFSLILQRTNGHASTNLSGFRSRGAGPFSDDDLALVRAIGPHLQRALAIHRELRAVEMVRDAALASLDQVPGGWILVSEDGAILATNRHADEVLNEGDALRVDGGRLRAEASQDARLAELISKAAGAGHGGPGGTLDLVRGGDGPRLRAAVTPLRHLAFEAGERRPAAMIFIEPAEPDNESRVDRLRRLYGLTPAESRVVGLLSSGRRLSEIATDVGISINTVRGHLKQVFAKTGTHRQAELVRLVLEGPSGG